jgi:hypothetical protein
LIIVKNKFFGSWSGYGPDSRINGEIPFFDELDVFFCGAGGFTLVLSSKE